MPGKSYLECFGGPACGMGRLVAPGQGEFMIACQLDGVTMLELGQGQTFERRLVLKWVPHPEEDG